MSKTTKSYKGKKYKSRKADNKKKAKGEKKFFGFTSGQHSRGVYDHEYVTDEKTGKKKLVHVKTDRAPVKGKDFVKYGWPLETRNKKTLKNRDMEREADADIEEALSKRRGTQRSPFGPDA